MTSKRVLIPLFKDEVAPRFDLAAEALIADVGADVRPGGKGVTVENFLLQQPSVDSLCDLALRKDVDVVVCGGIEEEYYHYLRWKRVEVLDNVAGTAQAVLERFASGALKSGDILFTTEDEHAR